MRRSPWPPFLVVSLCLAWLLPGCVRDRFSGDGKSRSTSDGGDEDPDLAKTGPSRPDNEGTEPFEKDPETDEFALAAEITPPESATSSTWRAGIVLTAAAESVFAGIVAEGGLARWKLGKETAAVTGATGALASYTVLRRGDRLVLVGAGVELHTAWVGQHPHLATDQAGGSVDAHLLNRAPTCAGTYRVNAIDFKGAMKLVAGAGDAITGTIDWDDAGYADSPITGTCTLGPGGNVAFERPDAAQSYTGTLTLAGDLVGMSGTFTNEGRPYPWSAQATEP